MKRSHTIRHAIAEVLGAVKRPLTAEEIFAEISRRNLYQFKAQEPLHVLTSALRRHCLGLDFPSAHHTKYFERVAGVGVSYRLLEKPIQVEPTVYKVKRPGDRGRERIVTVATADHEVGLPGGTGETKHTEIQWRLLELGRQLGFSTWAPKPDRSKRWKGRRIGDVLGLVESLPRQFDEATMKIISYIDVIWLQQSSIVAAFEIEHTTPVYSGLLRMADLMCMQPNLQIDWYLVAPENRFEKFAGEVGRPTFCNLRRPLHESCRFLAYTRLIARLEAAREFVGHLKPGFLKDISERYDPAEAFED